MVLELINGNDRSWNIDALEENFIPTSVEAILKVPLSKNLEEDVLAWAYERNVCYSGSVSLILKDSQMAVTDHEESDS
jgi:hypothetical protein